MKRTHQRFGYNHDGRFGISSCRVMDGEDLSYGDRKKMQAQQQKDWLDQQMREKRQKERMEKEQESAYAQQDLAIVKMRTMMEDDTTDKHKQMTKAMKDYNAQLALEKANKQVARKASQQQQDRDEIQLREKSEFMNEDFKTTVSAFQSHRHIPYNFKGLSEEQKQKIRDEREQQLRDNRNKNEQEKEQERLWAMQQEANRQMQLASEQQIQRKQREMIDAQKNNNQALDLEKKQRWPNYYGDKDDLPYVEGQ